MDLLTSIELYLMRGKWYQFMEAHEVEELEERIPNVRDKVALVALGEITISAQSA